MAPCGCNDLNNSTAVASSVADTAATQLVQTLCPATVHETVCVQARVTIVPVVNVGEIQTFCVGGPVIGACPGTPSPTNSCTFTVSQNVCVQIPLDFSADATAEPTGIICGTPTAGNCQSTANCTLTIGYFKNHPDVTNALIEAAGGTIVLGIDAQGASFTVTTANANDVLSLNTPTPPAPPNPPLDNQYQVLYAQLLAAKLNVLRGAICEFAVNAINNADAFIAASVSGVGQAGAPLYSAPLDEFNNGLAAGCPEHCPGA